VNTALVGLNNLFNQMYPDPGRASIAPEKLMRALLLQVFYSIRSERQLMEQIRYNLLFRWFVGLAIDDSVWDHSVFSKNRDRLIEHEAVDKFFTEVMSLADQKGLLSKEHFSVDGTLIQAWASHKSFRPKDGGEGGPGAPGRNVGADWKGRPRSNETHASTTDPDSRLFRKGIGQPAILCYQSHALMENRSGLVVGAVVTHPARYGERRAAVQMMNTIPGRSRKTLGADKAYDTAGFVEACRRACVTPHVAMNSERPGGSAIDERTSRHSGGPGQPANPQTHRRALWLGQYDRPAAANRVSWHPAGRPALQAHLPGEQHRANQPNTGSGARICTGSQPMKRQRIRVKSPEPAVVRPQGFPRSEGRPTMPLRA
jgi:transposase